MTHDGGIGSGGLSSVRRRLDGDHNRSRHRRHSTDDEEEGDDFPHNLSQLAHEAPTLPGEEDQVHDARSRRRGGKIINDPVHGERRARFARVAREHATIQASYRTA